MAATITTPQPLQALAHANAKRDAIARLRGEIRTGCRTLAEVLAERPEVLADWPVIDVVRLGYRKRSVAAIARLGRLAARDQVNLLVPLASASERTLTWVAANAWWSHRTTGGFAVYVNRRSAA